MWVHEIKHDGYRLMVHRNGTRLRYYTGRLRLGRPFPRSIVEATRLKSSSFLIDGEP